jgi:hypothetical protein
MEILLANLLLAMTRGIRQPQTTKSGSSDLRLMLVSYRQDPVRDSMFGACPGALKRVEPVSHLP